MKLPFLPLPVVFFPGEIVPLHIFENHYIQLIHHCQKEALTFGIPVLLDGAMTYGIEVQLAKIITTYEEGEMDVVCVARQVFKIQSFQDPMEGKGYPGGDVIFVELEFEADKALNEEVLQKIATLYHLMGMTFPKASPIPFNSYSFAHVIGLSFTQEYELLKIEKEADRLSYLNHHLDRITLLWKGKDCTRTLAGDKNLEPFGRLDFKDFKWRSN